VLVPWIAYGKPDDLVPVAPPRPVIFRVQRPPQTGDTVRAIQEALDAAGLDPGPIDGVYGELTAAAVRAYQQMHRLVVDGEVGPQTAGSLGVELTVDE
jgi:peptidoglycan hydrolase-like protein with peptidoglycan-binding domain